MVRSRFVVFPLFERLRLVTDGQNSTFLHTELDVPEIRHLFPHAEAVTLFYNTESRSSAEFAWMVFLRLDTTAPPRAR